MNDVNKKSDGSGEAAKADCAHFYGWVSPAGSSNSARLCMSCGQPDPAWLNSIIEGDKPEEIETEQYMRNAFYVDAIQVTAENMADVALWCEGVIKVTDADTPVRVKKGTAYIKINPEQEFRLRQTMAFVDDWVLKTDAGIKFYTDYSFTRSFSLVMGDNIEAANEEWSVNQIIGRIRFSLCQTRPMSEVDFLCNYLIDGLMGDDNPFVEDETVDAAYIGTDEVTVA